MIDVFSMGHGTVPGDLLHRLLERQMRANVLRYLLIAAATLPLAACMSAADQEARERALAARDDAACRKTGAKPGTQGYANCRTTAMQTWNTYDAGTDAAKQAAAVQAKASSAAAADTRVAVDNLKALNEQTKIDIAPIKPDIRMPTFTK
jgi:hypothetical protein